MKFKSVGRADRSLKRNKRPVADNLADLEKQIMKQSTYESNQAMFTKTLSNESTIKTKGNCINVQVVRSRKQSQNDINASNSKKYHHPRRRSRKDRFDQKCTKPSKNTINSRGGDSSISKSVKSK